MIGNINQIIEMLQIYKEKVVDTSYVIFINNKTYKKIQKELESCLLLKVIITETLPENTDAIVMTKEQYDNLYKGWI